MTREEIESCIQTLRFLENNFINDHSIFTNDKHPDNIEKIIKFLKENRWIPVSERAAEFPCLACDIFKQIFIPSRIVVLNNRCYDGKDFDFNVEKFLKGKEITTCGGEKLYVKPREITAWMPLPEPYQSND